VVDEEFVKKEKLFREINRAYCLDKGNYIIIPSTTKKLNEKKNFWVRI